MMEKQHHHSDGASDTMQSALSAVVTAVHEMPVVQSALTLLAAELPRNLCYHSKAHTEDVLHESLRYAVMDNLSPRELELLAVAAAFHDTGFVKSPVANEAIGAELARRAMAQCGGFSEEEIALVERMILDTTLVELPNGPQQIPSTNLSRYLLDGDLSNLGRDDFFDKGELQRKELGIDETHFRKRSLQLLNAHRWFTHPARDMRQKKKEENLLLLKSMISPVSEGASLSFDRLGFLAKLPLLLNASLDTRKVIRASLNELKTRLNAQAATIFLFDHTDNTLCFWAMHGSEDQQLERIKIPSNKGIVGWVLERQEPLLVNDVSTDPRFFGLVDESSGFQTRNLICAPLTVRMADKLGAVEVLNKVPSAFTEEDLEFLCQFASQIALAIENAKLYESVKEQSRHLEFLDNRKTEVMNLIAHEFEEPVNLIGDTAAALDASKTVDESSLVKMRRDLHAGVSRITRIIDEIRDLSIATSSSFTIHKTSLSVFSLAEGIVRSFVSTAADKGISLTQAVTTDASGVEADQDLLSLALGHLISNALHFTPSGGRVHLKIFQNAGLVHFEVRDSGVGIPPDQISLIFEKFYRVDGAVPQSQAHHGGLGLGLPTVQAILKAHGTSCSVQSSPGNGSVFSFSLPLAGDKR
jgi:signal transduction histidine kinase/predicted metal-dependent HD superfamily phosphohydrolase